MISNNTTPIFEWHLPGVLFGVHKCRLQHIEDYMCFKQLNPKV